MDDIAFDSPGMMDWLEAASVEDLDGLPFGVVGLSPDGCVARYNAMEARSAGLTPSRLLGRKFFTNVAPCANNCMVAQRFETEVELDAFVDYVFALRMMLRKVRLRLLKRPGAKLMYMLVENREA